MSGGEKLALAARATAASARDGGGGVSAARRRHDFRAAVLLTALLLALFLLAPACAAPHRQKRVSDQRLAELETRVALNRLKGIVVTVPVGFGKVDPAKLGRRRRSEEEALAAAAAAAAGDAGAGDGADGPDSDGDDALGFGDADGPGGRLAELIASLQMQRLAQQREPHWTRLGFQMK